jgi:hypothetical protein
VGPRAALDGVAKRKSSACAENRTPIVAVVTKTCNDNTVQLVPPRCGYRKESL